VAGAGVYLMNPEQTALLFEPGAGQTMLGAAGGLMLIGMLIVRWMVKPQP
jgi:Flp pilus assembly protein TadB